MNTIIWLELKKVLRNRLWQMSVVVCLLLSVFCLFLEKETSKLPPLLYPSASQSLQSEADTSTVDGKQQYYAALKSKYDLAQELYSYRMNAGLIPPGAYGNEEESDFNEQTIEECRELLLQGIQRFRVRYEVVAWYDRYYSSLVNYPQMTEEVLSSLDTVTPFSAGQPKSQKEQTRNLYITLHSQKLTDEGWMFWEMFSQSLVNFFWLAAVLITVLIFLESDERARMTEVIHTGTSSFRRLFLCRLGALSVLLIGLTAVFIVTKCAVCVFLYGLPAWQNAVQSIPSFYSCPYSWDIAQWFGVMCFLQIMQALLTGTLLYLLYSFCRRKGYLIFFILFGISALLYLLLGSYTWLEWIRQINLYTMLLPDHWFVSLQFFGDFTRDTWSWTVLLLLLTACLCIGLLFPAQYRIYRKRKHTRRLPSGSGTVAAHQIHLLTIHNPCFVLFLLTALFAAGNCTLSLIRNHAADESIRLAEHYREYGGPLTKQKARLITEKYADYEELDEVLRKAGSQHAAQQISDEEYIEFLDDWTQKNQDRWLWQTLYNDVASGKEYLGYGAGYQMLLGLNTTARDEKNALLAALLILLFCGSLFSAEHRNHADDLFRTAPGNARRLRLKMAAALGAGGLVFLFVYGMDFLQAAILYPMEDWNLPLQSVVSSMDGAIRVDPSLLHLTAGQAYLGVLLTRFLGILSCLLLVLICSITAETPAESLLTGLSVLAIGWLLIQTGMNEAALFSPRWLLEGNLVFLEKHNFWSFVIAGILSGIVWRLYSRNQRLFKKLS